MPMTSMETLEIHKEIIVNLDKTTNERRDLDKKQCVNE